MLLNGEAKPRGVAAYIRILLAIIILLVFLAGIQLYILSERTDRYFAWTIALPLTAAFLGAGYWSALVSSLAAYRQKDWAHMRSSLPAAFTSTTLLLAATLIHLDKFHLHSPEFITRLAAWVWVLVYVVVPPAVIAGVFIQRRMPGSDPLPRMDFPAWMRALLILQAAATLVTGALLFIVPQSVSPAWAWALTPLTARAVGAWFGAYGVAAIALLAENDLSRARATLLGLLVFGLLQGLALLRYAGSVDWSKPGAWLYVLFLLTVLGVNAAGLLAARSSAPAGARP